MSSLRAQMLFETFVYGGVGQAQLDYVTAVAVSPDGRHVYTASFDNHAITIFDRNASTGKLNFTHSFRDGENGIYGLKGTHDIVVSPDGNHVYAAGLNGDAIVVFERNTNDGMLQYKQTLTDGEGGIDGLDGVVYMALSPDGNYLYASGAEENGVAVFSRNVTTGQLSFVEAQFDGSMGVEYLGYPGQLTVSPDGNHLYITTYDNSGVVVFSRNNSTGRLQFVEAVRDGVDGVTNMFGPNGLKVSPDGQHLLVAASESSALVVFDRDNTTGKLSYRESQVDGVSGVDGIEGAWRIETSPNGEYVYALGSYENAVAVFNRTGNGALNFITKLEDGSSADGIAYPYGLSVSADGENLYVAGFESNALAVFEIQSGTGNVFFTEKEVATASGIQGMGGARDVVISPDDNFIYLAGEDDNSLVAFKKNANGTIDYIDNYKDGRNGVDGLSKVKEVVVSPDGKHLYATSFGEHSVAHFNRNETTGELLFVKKYTNNSVPGLSGLLGAFALDISPDGTNIYATGYFENSLVVLNRDPNNGSLSFSQKFTQGASGVDGLTWGTSVQVSRDNDNVYVTSTFKNSVAVFSRASDGTLTYMEVHKDGTAGINGLDGAREVLISHDNKHVYVCGTRDDAIVIFNRNANGSLTYVSSLFEGADDVQGINGVESIGLDADGDQFYASSPLTNSVAVFRRNPANGDLLYLATQYDDTGNTNGIGGASEMAFSEDGRHMYVAGSTDDAIAVFSCTYLLDITETICSSDSVVVGSNVYKNTGQYRDTFFLSGCWTVIDLDLTVYPNEVEQTVQICDGDSYSFGGTTYKTSGTYTKTFTSSLSCDSTVTLQLEVVSSFDGVAVSHTMCAGDVYSFGDTPLTTSGTYTETFVSSGGCDSTVVLSLQVNETYDAYETAEICEGEFYAFGDRNYIQTGIYTNRMTSVNGCDSTITLQLTVINPSGPTTIDANICQGDAYQLNGNAYDQAGTYTEVVTTNSGCQSTLTLNLSVVNGTETEIDKAICPGGSYDFGGVSYSTAGRYTQTFSSVNGCDSTIVLNLVISEPNTVLEEVICEGESYNMGGILYSQEGTYEQTFQSVAGCGDSTVTLNLRVEAALQEIVAHICTGETYEYEGNTYSQTGTYVDQITTSNGCSVDLRLHLIVHDPQEIDLVQTICFGEQVVINGEMFDQTGTYTEVAKTRLGSCDSTIRLNLTVLPEIVLSETINNDDGSGTGSIDVTTSGGNGSFTYVWSNGATTANISGLTAGSYTVTVTDGNQCQEIATYEVNLSTGLTVLAAAGLEVDLYPNPAVTDGQTTLAIQSDEQKTIELEVWTIDGKQLQQQVLPINQGHQVHPIQTPAVPGLYFIRLKEAGQALHTIKLSVQ